MTKITVKKPHTDHVLNEEMRMRAGMREWGFRWRRLTRMDHVCRIEEGKKAKRWQNRRQEYTGEEEGDNNYTAVHCQERSEEGRKVMEKCKEMRFWFDELYRRGRNKKKATFGWLFYLLDISSLIKANIASYPNFKNKTHIGATETTFKAWFTDHQKSLISEKYENEREISQEVRRTRHAKHMRQIKWLMLKQYDPSLVKMWSRYHIWWLRLNTTRHCANTYEKSINWCSHLEISMKLPDSCWNSYKKNP